MVHQNSTELVFLLHYMYLTQIEKFMGVNFGLVWVLLAPDLPHVGHKASPILIDIDADSDLPSHGNKAIPSATSSGTHISAWVMLIFLIVILALRMITIYRNRQTFPTGQYINQFGTYVKWMFGISHLDISLTNHLHVCICISPLFFVLLLFTNIVSKTNAANVNPKEC